MEAWVAARTPKPVSPSWNPNLGIVLRIVLFQVRVQAPRDSACRVRPAAPEFKDSRPTHSLVLALDREKFDIKNEHGIGADRGAWASRTIGHFGWNEKLPLGSYRHELEGFRPSFDDFVHRESCGLAALVGTVEFRAVNERASIVADNRVGSQRLWSRTWRQYLVLKTAWQRDDTLFRLVGRQKRIALFLVYFSSCLHRRFLLFVQIGLERHNHGLCLIISHERLAASQRILQALHDDGRVNFHGILLEAPADIHPDGVAELVFLCSERRVALAFCRGRLTNLRRRRLSGRR